jgi:hypothetical protein
MASISSSLGGKFSQRHRFSSAPRHMPLLSGSTGKRNNYTDYHSKTREESCEGFAYRVGKDVSPSCYPLLICS